MLRKIIKSLEETFYYMHGGRGKLYIKQGTGSILFMCWVNYEFEVHEEFIGLHAVDSTDANHIFAVIKAQLHIPMNKIRGDGMMSCSYGRHQI